VVKEDAVCGNAFPQTASSFYSDKKRRFPL
jgi:hypothetical protein